MLSQYSWWDFVKFILLLALPYYGYVLWKYYRQDIREWLTNRKQPTSPAQAVTDSDEEEGSRSLYPVTGYSDEAPAEADGSTPAAGATDQPVQGAPSQAGQAHRQEAWTESEDIDMSGPAVAGTEDIFGLPMAVAGENPQEQSVDELISAAQRLTTNEQGGLSPVNPEDKPAARIAKVLNNQLGLDILGDMPFKR
ncbi:hypothetical protein GCM10023187_53650 [Nibrella viscosa]|uniref:Uncharacterized protein n=1 Tax=Nibrella viscosa TaxID=1084524 RepID=A0ABP8L0L7_9BACT